MHGGRARTACQLSLATIVHALHMPGDGQNIFQREQRRLLDLDSVVRRSAANKIAADL